MKKKLVNREPIGNSNLNCFIKAKIDKANRDNGFTKQGKTHSEIIQDFGKFVKEVKIGVFN